MSITKEELDELLELQRQAEMTAAESFGGGALSPSQKQRDQLAQQRAKFEQRYNEIVSRTLSTDSPQDIARSAMSKMNWHWQGEVVCAQYHDCEIRIQYANGWKVEVRMFPRIEFRLYNIRDLDKAKQLAIEGIESILKPYWELSKKAKL